MSTTTYQYQALPPYDEHVERCVHMRGEAVDGIDTLKNDEGDHGEFWHLSHLPLGSMTGCCSCAHYPHNDRKCTQFLHKIQGQWSNIPRKT